MNDISDAQLSELDEQVLELAALQAPWYMICGEFHRQYGGPGVLARRLYELQGFGLVEVLCSTPDATVPTAALLEADALAHDCYDEVDATHDPQWEIITSDRGMEAIRTRLEAE